MRSASVVESDWSEDTATLVYDLAVREAEIPPFSAAASTAPPRRHTRERTIFSGTQIALLGVAMLIGAMAGAWSVAEQARSAARPAEPLSSAAAKPASVEQEHSAPLAAAMPQVIAPTPSAPEVSPKAEAALEPPSTVVATAAPAPQAAPSKPQPKARIAAAHDRPKRKTEARSRSARSTLSPPAVSRPEPARASTPPAPQPVAPRMGRLRINSRPWSKIFVDDRPAGTTPQTAVELAPGHHRIVLINDEFGLRRTLTVEVRAGQTISRSVELLQ